LSISTNGAEAPERTADGWYGATVAAARLGINGQQLRELRDSGGLPDSSWRRITVGKARHIEYNPTVIDKLAVANAGESSNVAEEATAGVKHISSDVPLEQVELEPAAIEALAAIGKLGPVRDAQGRARAVLVELMPRGAKYNPSTISTGTRVLAEYGLINRDTQAKRTYEYRISARGRRWLAANRDHLPHVPDPRAVTTTAEPAPPPEPEATAEAITQALAPEPAPEAPAVEPAPAPEAPQAGPDALPAPAEAPRATNTLAAPQLPVGLAEPVVDPGAIAAALLRQTVRVLNDSDVATLTAERDALAAHNATLVSHVRSLTERTHDAEAQLREAQAVLHSIEAQLTPMLTGQAQGLGWLDAKTRTDLLALVQKAAEWAR